MSVYHRARGYHVMNFWYTVSWLVGALRSLKIFWTPIFFEVFGPLNVSEMFILWISTFIHLVLFCNLIETCLEMIVHQLAGFWMCSCHNFIPCLTDKLNLENAHRRTGKSWIIFIGYILMIPELVPNEKNKVTCPNCKEDIPLGTSRIQNFYKWHKGSQRCEKKKMKNIAQEKTEKARQGFRGFFAPHAAPVPPMVTAPSCIHVPSITTTTPSQHSLVSLTGAPATPEPVAIAGCPDALRILATFCARILSPPDKVGEADSKHPLAQFSGSPMGWVAENEDGGCKEQGSQRWWAEDCGWL